MESGLYSATMSSKHFERLRDFIYSSCGIILPPAKKSMLEGRLRKRMRDLHIQSFQEYCDYLFSPLGSDSEHIHMIDVVTTNKTDFFREPDHFEYLSNIVLPELVRQYGLGVSQTLNVWSAGCSTGEEPYTLAMVLSEFAQKWPGFRFSILATDISTKVLERAQTGIYEHDKVIPISMSLRKKYLLRCKNKEKTLVRIAPEVRALVRFERLNFMEENYGIRDPLGVIFCRNVIIYFDRPTQEKLVYRLTKHLVPGGYLFMGHSESLHGMSLPLAQKAATIHKKS